MIARTSMRPAALTIARLLLLATVLLVPGASAADDPELKRDAIARVAASHDPAIAIGVGRVYIKQLGLNRAREMIAQQGHAAGLGAEWNDRVPEWQEAERRLTAVIDELIARRVEDPAWLRDAWGREADRILNAEEADEIAAHFATPGGQMQRAVIELLLVGETLVANYTMTDRIRYGVKGSEREMELLQRAWWVNDHRRVYDFTPYPNAVRFASQDPGLKYAKMLAIQGIDAVNHHLDAVAAEVRAALDAAQGEIGPQIRAYRRRAGG
jgi:hypothetical protein